MRRRIGVAGAVLLILAAASVAAVVGYAVGHKSDPPPEPKVEHVLSRAPTPPALPAYDPAAGWFTLPTPPAPEETTEIEEGEGEQVEPEPQPEIVEPGKEESTGGSGERKCFGVSVGPTC
jgi:hypothetical protein